MDGGSEFMAEFEDACADMKIPLIVLPPKKPEYNGGVERGNRTEAWKDYAVYSKYPTRGRLIVSFNMNSYNKL